MYAEQTEAHMQFCSHKKKSKRKKNTGVMRCEYEREEGR